MIGRWLLTYLRVRRFGAGRKRRRQKPRGRNDLIFADERAAAFVKMNYAAIPETRREANGGLSRDTFHSGENNLSGGLYFALQNGDNTEH